MKKQQSPRCWQYLFLPLPPWRKPQQPPSREHLSTTVAAAGANHSFNRGPRN